MAKIIKIGEETITIGTDDGGILEVKKESCNFKPKVNDEVDVFKNDFQTYITKRENELKAQNVSNGKRVKKSTYVILCLFLGGFGIHKFYAEKYMAGIIYLLLVWTALSAVFSIIDLIAVLLKKSDEDGFIYV